MSIDARVETVIINEDGGGRLKLVDRPPHRVGDNPGIAGQNSLSFDEAPEEVTALNGLDVWGGAEQIILGNKKIADRIGYGSIKFIGRGEFVDAIKNYHEMLKA